MNQKNENPISLASVLSEVAANLKKHPALLFAFGMAVVLLAAGTLALEKFRLILGGLLLLTILGLVIWVFQETNKAKKIRQARKEKDIPLTSIELEDTTVEKNGKVIGKIGNSNSNVNIEIKGSKVSGGEVIGQKNERPAKKN